jgi:acyl-CoA synthetase (NDP forming)
VVDNVDRNKMASALALVKDAQAVGVRNQDHAGGIRNPKCSRRFGSDVEEAVRVAEKAGYPVVMKIVSEDILHKSDSGGIALNIENSEQLRVEYAAMIDRIAKNEPQAHIRGVMIEKMEPRAWK